MTRNLVVGTRGSALALRQVDIVSQALTETQPGIEIERLVIRTEGDRRTEVSLDQIGGQGVFVKDIEARLLAGAIDLAVHSLKDMPATSPLGLVVAAVLPRADMRDVLVTRNGATLSELPAGARIGTDSRRRAVQLRAMRPDIRVESVRGNVETRMRKATEGELDAVILAAAGLQRLELLDEASQYFTIDEMLPAPGQGVLAVQCREDDAELREMLQVVDDEATRAAITAERAFLSHLGAGCRLPVGAYASVGGGWLQLKGMLASERDEIGRGSLAGAPADGAEIGEQLARLLAAAIGYPLEQQP